MADRRRHQHRAVILALDRDKFSLFMASLLAMIVMALSFYYGKVDFITVAERVAWTVFIVYPVTFFVVWRIVRVAMAELDVKTPEPDVEPKETETSATETDAGEGA